MKKSVSALAILMAAGAGAMVASGIYDPQPTQNVPDELGILYGETVRRDNRVVKRAMAGGTNLYGFVSDWNVNPEEWWRPYRGVFEISEYGDINKIYADPMIPDNSKLSSAFLLDGYLYGYAESYPDENNTWGQWSFVKVDFETGDIIDQIYTKPEGSPITCPMAYNPEDGYFYFCTMGAVMRRSTIADPTNTEAVKTFADNKQNLISLAYCPADKIFYGVTVGHNFVTVDTQGNITTIKAVPDRGSHATHKSGMVWAPNEELFYWNYQGKDGSSKIYSITRDGTFNLECELENAACMDWLVTPDERFVPGAPEYPVIDEIAFAEGSLSGSMTFTLAENMQNGNPIPEDLTWTVTLDGETYKTGTETPGKQVTVDFADLETGNHEFGVYATFDVFSCDPVTRRIWIGNDTPMAPTRVALTKENVSWDAPTAGVHAGYVDLANLSYEVTIKNVYGNTVYTGTTTETTLAYTLENPEDLSYYTAFVTATCQGLTSAPASSAGLIMGETMTPPASFTPTMDQFRLMKVVDMNGDGETWGWVPDYGGCLLSGYSLVDIKSMDEYVFLPAMSFNNSDRLYEITLDASAWAPQFTQEYLDVVLAVSPDYDGVIESLIDRTRIPCAYDRLGNQISDWTRLHNSFEVPATGVYYIGFHCSSAAQMAGILVRNIKVEDGGVMTASPAMVDDIVTTPADNGVLEATVAFHFPTLTVNGNALPADAALTATVTTSVASATATGVPGSEAVVTLATVQGDNEVSVIVTDAEGLNSPRGIGHVFTGQVVPDVVTNLRGVISDDMLEFALYWDAPTKGEQGGFIIPEELTYNVYYYDPYSQPSNWVPLSKGQTDCFYKFHPEEQDYWRIAIEAVSPAGASKMVSGSAWAGPAYTLPFEETFSSPVPYYETKPWRIITANYHADWGLSMLSQVDANLYGADNRQIAMVCNGAEGTDGCVAMPRFSTMGLNAAHVTLDIYTGPLAAETRILGYSSGDTSKSYEIAKLPRNTFDGISQYSFDLPDFLLNQPWVQLMFEVYVDEVDAYFACTAVRMNQGSGVSIVSGDLLGSVVSAEGAVRCIGLDGNHLTIATTDGKIVASEDVKGNDYYCYLQPGLYIVSCGNINTKVIVK